MRFLKNIFKKSTQNTGESKPNREKPIYNNPTSIYQSRFQSRFQTTTVPNFNEVTELHQISGIFDWVFHPIGSIALDAAKTIHLLIKTQAVAEHKTLYYTFKYVYLKKSELKSFKQFDDDIRMSLLCIASLNHNGYVREEALKHLSRTPSVSTFPFILFRLGDWVPKIKKIAEQVIRSMIKESNPELLIIHHKTIDWLLKVQRHDLKNIHKEISEFIFSTENLSKISKSLSKYSESERYYIYRNICARPPVSPQILESILSDKNHMIRLLAVRNNKQIKNPQILKRLLKDKNQRIRYYSIYKITEDKINLYTEELEQLIFDKQSTIRFQARKLLTQVKSLDYYHLYKTKNQKKPNVGSIVGLSEVGDINDLDFLFKLLNSKQAKHRSAALFAIYNLDNIRAKEAAFKYLEDESNTVKKACTFIIQKEKSTQDLEILRDIYKKGDAETKRFTLKTISQYGGWSIAGDLLIGLSESDEKLRNMSEIFLQAWCHYSIRLGIAQKPEDKIYVLRQYNKIIDAGIKAPKEIPFIFKDK